MKKPTSFTGLAHRNLHTSLLLIMKQQEDECALVSAPSIPNTEQILMSFAQIPGSCLRFRQDADVEESNNLCSVCCQNTPAEL